MKDISGSDLPGISEVGVFARRRVRQSGKRFSAGKASFSVLVDASYRSSFSSSATASKYLVVDGYALLNARVGFRWADGWSISVWSRNLLDKDYFELLTAAPGNTGLYVGQPGDQQNRWRDVARHVSDRHRSPCDGAAKLTCECVSHYSCWLPS